MRSPAWARLLLSWLSPRHRHEEILGDLEEVHRRREERHGAIAAWTLTSLDAAALAASMARRSTWLRAQRGMIPAVEVRLALRLLARTPVLSVTAALALTVGVTLATTGFTVVSALLNPRLPIPEGHRVVELSFRDARTGVAVPIPLDFVRGLGGGSTTLAQVGLARTGDVNVVSDEGGVALVPSVRIQPGAFSYVPMVPLLGRALEERDASGGVPQSVVVLSEGMWTRRFGRDPDVIGRRISVGSAEHEVVGVLPGDVTFPAQADLWLPLGEAPDPSGRGTVAAPATVYGLLRPGVSSTAAQAEMATLASGWRGGDPGAEDVTVRLRPVGEVQGAGLQGGLVVAVLVGLLLVIAGNVGNLMVARTASRRGELTIRAALGASRGRLVAQLSLEALVLTIVASGLGLWASQEILARFAAAEAAELPPWLDLHLRAGVALFVVFIAGLVTAAAGIAPALGATRGAKGAGRDSARAFGAFHDSMIVAQIALSVGVLGAAIMVHAGWSRGGDPLTSALPAGNIVAAQIDLPPSEPLRTRDALEAAVASLPTVVTVASSTYLPGADAPLRTLEVEGTGGTTDRVTVPLARVGRDFFEVVEGRAAAGRLFGVADFTAPPSAVALVNEAFVRRHLSGANAVGRRIRLLADGDRPTPWYEIVGVVAGLPMSANDPDRAGGVYLPLGPEQAFRLLARTDGPASELTTRIQPAAFSVHPEIAVSGIRVLSDVLRALARLYLIIASVFSALGAMVLLLSLLGIYSVLSFEVTRRTPEIGVRVALGAGTADVLRPVLGRVAVYAVVGGALGTGLGLLLVRLAQAMFVMRFPPTGPGAFAVLVGVALAAAVVAAWMPTRRALAIHPAEALRSE